MTRFLYTTALIMALALCTGCINDKEEPGQGGNIAVGDKLPDLSLTLSDGTAVDNGTLEGKVSLIILFSVTCPDCQAQLPVTEQFYEDYGSRIEMFGISRAEGEGMIGKYWQDNGFRMPYSPQEDRQVYNLFAASVVPRIYIADRNRIVRAVFTDNPLAGYQDLKNAVDPLLDNE